MRRLYIQAFALFACILAVTASPVAVENAEAANPVVTMADSSTGGWNQTSPRSGSAGDITQDGSNNYGLATVDAGQSDYYADGSVDFGEVSQSTTGDGSGTELVYTDKNYDIGTKLSETTGMSLGGGYGGGAAVSGSTYILEAGSVGSCVASDCFQVTRLDGTQVAAGSGKQVAGAAEFRDPNTGNVVFLMGDRSSTGTTKDDFVMVDPSDGSTEAIQDNDYEWVIGGIALTTGSASNDICVIELSQYDLECLEINSAPGPNTDADITFTGTWNIPAEAHDGRPSGLVHIAGSDIFATFDRGDNQIVYWDRSTGNVIKTVSKNTGGHLGSIHRSDSGFTEGTLIWSDPSNNRYQRYTSYDLTSSQSVAWTSDTYSAKYTGQDVQVHWAIGSETSQPAGETTFKLQASVDGGGWTTVKSYTTSATSITETIKESGTTTFSAVNSLQFRVVMDPGDRHPFDYIRSDYDGSSPCGGDGTCFDATFYTSGGSSGQVNAHKTGDESVGVDFTNVYDHKWWNFSINTQSIDGSDGSSVNFEAINENGEVVCSVSNIDDNPTLNISSTGDCTVDESLNKNQHLTFNFEFTSSGLSTEELVDWTVAYEKRGSDPNITSYEATVNGTTYDNQTSLNSEIGNTDTFTVEAVNQTIDSVTWYVNGKEVTQKMGDIPSSFSYTWDSAQTGTNTVTAEVFNERNGTDTVTWRVTVPSPKTVKLGTIDDFEESTSVGLTATQNVTVDFPGDTQTVTTEFGTLYGFSIDPSNPDVTYNVTMAVSEPIGTEITFTNLTGYAVKEASASRLTDLSQNLDGEYKLRVEVNVTDGNTSSFEVNTVYKQQIADAQSTPDVRNVKVPSAAHRGDAFDVSATVGSDITSVRQVWLEVIDPSGDVSTRQVVSYKNTRENESVDYTEHLTLNKTGTYEVTVVGQNYDRLNGTSRTYVIDVQNSPPTGQLLEPPTQVNANRSVRFDWRVSDPENDTITQTGIYLVSPSGGIHNFTDDEAGAGRHTLTVGPGNMTSPGLWAVKSWQQDAKGGLANSSREIVEVVSLQEYAIQNATIGLWNGTTFDTDETPTLHAGREVEVNAKITPNVSSTVNGTVYVNLETESGTLVSELSTATSVTLTNGTTVNLTEIHNGTVSPRLPVSANGSYVIEIGVVSESGESTYRIPVEVRGVTTGEIQSLSLNKEEVYPPEFLTVVTSVFNDGEQDTTYNLTVEVTKNGTTYLTKSVNTTDIRTGDAASAGLGFQIPEDLPPGAYTLEVSLASLTHSAWDVFDRTSVPFTVKQTRQAEIDTVDLTYESGVIQGAIAIENDGNVPLSDGSLRVIVQNAATEERVAVEDVPVSAIKVGTARQTPINFNFSADRNTTYYLELRYDEGNVSDGAYTQIATAPQPSMQVVDIDGPEELVQGQNATYTITVSNNGDVRVNSTSLLVRLQTGQGRTVVSRGVVVDATYPGKSQTMKVTLPITNASLLGQSTVSVVGQAHTGNNTTLMLPRESEVFVSAPGFIISGDSAFSDLSVGESFTVTETFLVVGRPDAAITVQAQYDREALKLISGDANQTLTSGASVSWTFVVKEPVGGNPLRIVATSGSQRKAKAVAVATVGSTGMIGNLGEGLASINGYEDVWTNTYTAAVLPGFDYGVYALLQWLVAIALVAVVQFHNATQPLTPLQKHGGSVVVAGWASGVMPVVMVLISGTYGVLVYIERKYGFS